MIATVACALLALAAYVMFDSGASPHESIVLAAGPAGAALIIAFLASS
jgi:hypothetical protein